MTSRRRYLTFALSAALLPMPLFPVRAFADAGKVPSVAEHAKRWGSDSVEGRFVERRRIAGFPKPLKSEGRFSINRTSGARWMTEKPFASTLIIDKSGMRYESASSNNSVSAGNVPAVGRLGDFMQGVFAGDLEMLEGVFTLTVSGTNPVTVTAEPKAGTFDTLSRIEITGRDSVEKIVMTSPTGDITELELLDVVKR